MDIEQLLKDCQITMSHVPKEKTLFWSSKKGMWEVLKVGTDILRAYSGPSFEEALKELLK